MNKKIHDAMVLSNIVESHCIHSIEGDPGEARHERIMYVLKQFPDLDYMDVSHEMERLDKQEHDTCKMNIRRAAERQVAEDF